MRKIFFFTTIVLFLCSFACVEGRTDQVTPRKIKPYNPEKAGAVIVESFDLTGDRLFVPPARIYGNYDMAEYNDCIYLKVGSYSLGSNLYIFEKETMRKQRELKLNILSNIDVRYTLGNRGLAVVNSDTAFLLCYRNGSSAGDNSVYYDLASIDLTTGDSLIINDEEKLGFNLNSGYPYPLMGYNKDNESIWFLTDHVERYKYFFYFFQYDKDEQNFITVDYKRGFFPGEAVSVYGNEIWNIVCKWDTHPVNPTIVMVGIEKRNIDNPDEVLYFIDVEYLGTLTVPQSVIYDKPYLWIMVEKDNQVQMLKLLPNDR